MEAVGYSDIYKSDVLACLKRNYSWMSQESDEELYKWLQPIINYKWAEELPDESYPYKFGMVLLNDGKVVGYLGLIYSKQLIDNEYKVVVNPTTWAIDDEFRLEIFKYIYEVQNTADILIDYTARESLVEIFTKMFHYENIDKNGCFFLPKPIFCKKSVKVKKVKKPEQIQDKHIRKMYVDHLPYNIKCMEIATKDKKEYVFYKLLKRESVIKKLIPLNAVNVLYTSSPSFFGELAKEIIWKMQRLERAALKTDSRYFNIDVSKLDKSRYFSVNRLKFSHNPISENISSMYTELAILLNE